MTGIAGRGMVPEVCGVKVNHRSVMIEMRVAIENQESHESVAYTCHFHPGMIGLPVDTARVRDKIQEQAQSCCNFVAAGN